MAKRSSAPSSSARDLEQRLEQALGNEHALARTDVAHTLVQVGDEVAELLARQRLDGHDGAVLHELIVGLLPHDLLDADHAKNLHRALGDLRRARMDGGAAVMLDRERRNPVMAEQQRR